MREFLYKVVFFTLPLLLLLILVEFLIQFYPNTFNAKASFLNKNKDVELLFLGSSHTQNAINPEYISMKSANLAYGNQDYTLDSALFFTNAKKLKSLKCIFLEVDYHSLESVRDSDYFRNSWYYRFYGISVFEVKLLQKVCLYSSSPEFFNEYYYKTFITKEFAYDMNQYGFIKNVIPSRFHGLKFDVDKINATYKDPGIENSKEKFNYNKRKILSIINYCNQNLIKVVLLKLPVFESFSNNYILSKNKRRLDLIDSLSRSENVLVLDYEKDNRFNVYDFKDDDHLCSSGAKKLSLILNKEIKNW